MTDRIKNGNTKTITFFLPPEVVEQAQDVMLEEGRTMSEHIARLFATTWRSMSGCGRSHFDSALSIGCPEALHMGRK